MADDLAVATADLNAAVRIFQKLVPVDEFNASQGITQAMVYTPWIVAWMMVYQRLNGTASLADAVAELANLDDDLLPQNKRTRENNLSFNTGAYAGGRSRLKLEAAQDAADRVSQALMAQGEPASDSPQRRTFLIDGSSIALTTAESLRQAYPPPKNQHGAGHRPAMRIVAAHDLKTGATLRPEVGPIGGPKDLGEVEMAGPLLQRLPKNSIVIGDRNFGIFLMAWLANQAGHDVLFRLTEVRFRALVRKATAVGPGTWRLNWEPSPWDRKHNPRLSAEAKLEVRLHEVRICETLTLWLVSSLEDSGAALAKTYHGRQQIETDLRDLKQTLRLEVIRSRSPEMIGKELAAATIAYNLVVLVRKLAAAEARVEPRRLSFARIHCLVKALLRPGRWALEPDQAQAWIVQTLRMAGQCRIPKRPDRSYPRVAFAKPTKYPRKKIERDSEQEK